MDEFKTLWFIVRFTSTGNLYNSLLTTLKFHTAVTQAAIYSCNSNAATAFVTMDQYLLEQWGKSVGLDTFSMCQVEFPVEVETHFMSMLTWHRGEVDEDGTVHSLDRYTPAGFSSAGFRIGTDDMIYGGKNKPGFYPWMLYKKEKRGP